MANFFNLFKSNTAVNIANGQLPSKEGYFCLRKPLEGKSMKGYCWAYFVKHILPPAIKQNPHIYYYKIQGKDIHPSFWKDEASTVMRVNASKGFKVTKEERNRIFNA